MGSGTNLALGAIGATPAAVQGVMQGFANKDQDGGASYYVANQRLNDLYQLRATGRTIDTLDQAQTAEERQLISAGLRTS